MEQEQQVKEGCQRYEGQGAVSWRDVYSVGMVIRVYSQHCSSFLNVCKGWEIHAQR